jgi:hypothetical protein
MNLIDEARQRIKTGTPPDLIQAQALFEAYDQAQDELERLHIRIGDLEFHYEVFEHLMIDRQQMIGKLSELGLEIYSLPNPDKGSWGWAWRWRGGEPHIGYERSIQALVAAFETMFQHHLSS